MTSERTALVIGATGGIGGAVAATLLARGWRVRALSRDPGKAERRLGAKPGLTWVRGDAMNPAEVCAAAEGVAFIAHGANPPGYRNWAGLAVPMLESTISAARASGARILFPGTIYNYGPDAFPVLREDAAQRPLTKKGAIRVAMEARLRAASATGVRSLVVRAGDFYGPGAENSWLAQGLIASRRPVRVIRYPGPQGIGHSWAYLPDLAEAMVRLVERADALPPFANFHFAGHFDSDGTAMCAAIADAVGRKVKVRRFPWAAVVALSPFVTLFREMLEMRYLWREPLRLDNKGLVAAIGAEPDTPLNAAVLTTLAGLGCLPAEALPRLSYSSA